MLKVQYVTSRGLLYEPLLDWLLVWHWIRFLSKCWFLGFSRLLLVRGAFSCHVSLLITVEALPFFPIMGFIFLYVGTTDKGKAWFIYIYRNIGLQVVVRISVSSLAILSWWRGVLFIFLQSQHSYFLVGSFVFNLGHFFPSSYINRFCFPIKDLCEQSLI